MTNRIWSFLLQWHVSDNKYLSATYTCILVYRLILKCTTITPNIVLCTFSISTRAGSSINDWLCWCVFGKNKYPAKLMRLGCPVRFQKNNFHSSHMCIYFDFRKLDRCNIRKPIAKSVTSISMRTGFLVKVKQWFIIFVASHSGSWAIVPDIVLLNVFWWLPMISCFGGVGPNTSACNYFNTR